MTTYLSNDEFLSIIFKRKTVGTRFRIKECYGALKEYVDRFQLTLSIEPVVNA